MSFFGALGKAWDVASEAKDAVRAGRDVLEAGGSPIAALKAFAAATNGALDDQAVAELEVALRNAIKGLHTAAVLASKVAEHEDAVEAMLRDGLSMLVEWGWVARGWESKLALWLGTDTPPAH